MNKASLAALLVLAATINATTFQNLGLLVDINGTVYTNTNTLNAVFALVNDTNATVSFNRDNLLSILNLSQQINLTTLQNQGYLIDINGTVYVNKAALLEILGVVNDTNQTVYMNRQTLENIMNLSSQINITTLQTLGLAQDINGTVYLNTATLNTIIGLANETNSTVWLNWILLNNINSTSNYIQMRVDQMNLTVDQIYSLLGSVNSQVVSNGVMLSTINNKVINLTNLAQAINLTTEQTYALLYNLSIGNITVTAIVNNTAIAEAVWNADVEEFQVSPASPSYPVTGGFLGGIAYAAPSDSGVNAVCLGNSTLMNFVVRTRCVNNVCNTIQTNATITCQYGCNSDEVPNFCNPSPSQTNWIFFAIISIIIALVIVAIAKLR